MSWLYDEIIDNAKTSMMSFTTYTEKLKTREDEEGECSVEIKDKELL